MVNRVIEKFGKFRLARHLATGGMAEIYLAYIDGPGGFSKPVALKRVKPEHASNPEFLRMLELEARVVAQMHHPNIVQTLEYGIEHGIQFICMEYVPGPSLHALIRAAAKKGQALNVKVASLIGLQIARALAYAHDVRDVSGRPLGIIHRDVTPGNIIVSRSGQVKLADFGVVKVTEGEAQTKAGIIKGKFAYMSPEQVSGVELDLRCDIFSLGIVLYEVALGKRLFKRAEAAAELMAVSKAQVPKPRDYLPEFPEEFQKILLKCLRRDRERRYSNANGVAVALERFISNSGWTDGDRLLADVVDQLCPPQPQHEPRERIVSNPSLPQTQHVLPPVKSSDRRALVWGIAIVIVLTLSIWLWVFVFLE